MNHSTRGSKKRGALALKLGAFCAGVTLLCAVVIVALLQHTLGSAIAPADAQVLGRGWLLGLLLSAISGVAVGLVAYLQGSALATRITDLGLAVAKIGRGTSEVRVRLTGKDELTALQRAVQYLATDLTVAAEEAARGGGVGASQDPMVREMRDKALPKSLASPEGFELDGALVAGSRGGLDYFDCVSTEQGAALLMVGHEGAGTVAAAATRLARDEIIRALKTGATPRKALSHTNRVLHRELPKGACAKACVVELEAAQAKIYQAGFRSPVLVCSAGRIAEHNAEGLALGLDEGAVFEKGLRSTVVPIAVGIRLVVTNEAALRLDGLPALISQHSAKNTAAFMNFVLGTLEREAGEGGLREDIVLLTAKRS